MDKNQELIRQCRYYKGEKECPASLIDAGYLHVWTCERDWVLGGGNRAFKSDRFQPPYGYKNIWSEDVHIPEIDGYSTPINLRRMLFSYYCYYNGVHPDHISTKMVSSYSVDKGHTRVSVHDGFEIFLRDKYYSESSSSQSNTM